MELSHSLSIFQSVEAKRQGKPEKNISQDIGAWTGLKCLPRRALPFRQFFQMVKLDGISVDEGSALQLLQLLEFDNEGLDHRLGSVNLIVIPCFAQSGFDDVA